MATPALPLLLRGIPLSAPMRPYLSNVTGTWITPQIVTACGTALLLLPALAQAGVGDFRPLGTLERTIHPEMARELVHLVFHRVGGDDLDVDREDDRGVGTRRDAVPRVRLEKLPQKFP